MFDEGDDDLFTFDAKSTSAEPKSTREPKSTAEPKSTTEPKYKVKTAFSVILDHLIYY